MTAIRSRSTQWVTALALTGTVLGAVTLSGCKNREIPPPYKIGTVLSATQDLLVTSIDYKMIEGGEPVLSKGTMGAGANCAEAQRSTGQRRTEAYRHMDIDWEVVGETPWDHPLLPGNDFSRTWLSVVWDVTRTSGSAYNTESFVAPDPTVATVTTTQYVDLTPSHEASYYGVAADEYLIKVTSLDLWNNLEDTALNQGPLTLNTSSEWVGVNSAGGQTVQLMTKHKPRNNDVWSSTNGNFLNFYTGKDNVHVGDKTHKADRVLIKTTGDADPEGGGVLNDCVTVARSELTTDLVGATNDLVDIALLDAECTGSFKHQVVGHEWWQDGALVRAQTTTYEVTINDWGFEWYAFDATGTTCQRFVSTRKDDLSAKRFIEYTVDDVTTSYAATLLDQKGKKLRGPHEEAQEIDPADGDGAATAEQG